ncbi:MAG: hypothetical protein J6B98_04085 [Bacilli bacterium]|nr:hypothetical protein [Bacilli bacterium]
MKKRTIIILSIITLILTFIFAEIFSIYHFGSIPTLLTSLYLMSIYIIFAIFEYLLVCITYVIRKLIKKEKIGIKKIIGLILLFIALLLVLLFLVVVNADYLNWYMYSSPFYLNVIVRSVEFLLPSLILIVVSIIFLKKKK